MAKNSKKKLQIFSKKKKKKWRSQKSQNFKIFTYLINNDLKLLEQKQLTLKKIHSFIDV